MPKWYVLYTKPRNEKKLAERLQSAGFEIYCPLIKTVKQWSDRKKKVSEPLFKSYIFVYTEAHLRERVFAFPGAVRYLFWLGEPAIARNEEIDAIKQFLNEHGDSKTITASSFSLGSEVKIVGGPLKDHQGVVIRASNKKITLQVQSLGMSIQAELHPSFVV